MFGFWVHAYIQRLNGGRVRLDDGSAEGVTIASIYSRDVANSMEESELLGPPEAHTLKPTLSMLSMK
jgi:hypothetical protein